MKKLLALTLVAAIGLVTASQQVLSQEDTGTPQDLYMDGKRKPYVRETFIRKPAAKKWVDDGEGITTLQGKNFAILKDNNNKVICYSNLTSGGIRCLKLSEVK